MTWFGNGVTCYFFIIHKRFMLAQWGGNRAIRFTFNEPLELFVACVMYQCFAFLQKRCVIFSASSVVGRCLVSLSNITLIPFLLKKLTASYYYRIQVNYEGTQHETPCNQTNDE